MGGGEGGGDSEVRPTRRRSQRVARRSLRRVEHRANAHREFCRRERFGQERHALTLDALVEQAVLVIAGDEEHAHPRAELRHALGEFAPGEAWHHDVGHEEVHLACVGCEDLQRLLTARGREHGVAESRENALDEATAAIAEVGVGDPWMQGSSTSKRLPAPSALVTRTVPLAS